MVVDRSRRTSAPEPDPARIEAGRLFDSHLHLTERAFEEDRAAVVQRAREAGVAGMVTVASTPADAGAALELVRRESGVWCTAGLHPHHASELGASGLEALRRLLSEPLVVAVGETGLDHHYDHSLPAAQREAFEAQLSLAAESGKPVVVHSRDADSGTADAIRRWSGSVRGVLHCFSGGDALLETGLDAGWYISFSGMVTFRRWEGAAALRRVPTDRLLIETDSPYLSPVPLRGRRNEPAHLLHTCRRVAEVRGVAPQAIAESTRRNALAFYGLPPGEG